MMHIAIDAGAMHAGDGIARYLERMIDAIDAEAGGSVRWSLYGRGEVHVYAERLRAARARSDRLPGRLGRTLGIFTSLPAWTRLDRPDVFWGPAHRLPGGTPPGTARVVTIHDLCWRLHPQTMRPITRWLDRNLMPRALHSADRIVATSHSTRDDLRRFYPREADRIRVVYPPAAVLPPPAAADQLATLGIHSPFALFVGTLEPRKNVHRLIEAFALLAGESASRQLVVVGARGWGGEPLEPLIDQHRLHGRVLMPGRVDDAVLATLYRHARMLVLPSLYEGFGFPLQEAMAVGTPVVTSDVSSMPEVAADAALYADPIDTDALAAAMRSLFDDDALHRLLAGRALVQAARFTRVASARSMLQAFDEAVQRRRRHRTRGGERSTGRADAGS
jgi:glycosyltransferase involved in cell wall biosynthesis